MELDTKQRDEAQKLAIEIAEAAEANMIHLEKTNNREDWKANATNGMTPAFAIAAYIIKHRKGDRK